MVNRTLVSSLRLEPAPPDIELDSNKRLFSFTDMVVESRGRNSDGEVSQLIVRPRTMDDHIRMVSLVKIGSYTGLNDDILDESERADVRCRE